MEFDGSGTDGAGIMKCTTCVELLIAVLLLLSGSSSVTSAIAGNAALVSPGQLLRPVINVTPRQTRQYYYQAVTRAPVRIRGRVRAGTLTWQCQGAACTISGPWPTPAVGACRALAKQVGAIQSYGYASKKLSAAQLKQCNTGITAQVRKPIRKQIRQAITRPAIKAPFSRARTAPVVTRPGNPAGLSALRASLPRRIVKPIVAAPPVIRAVRSSSHRPAPRLRVPVTIPRANPINRPTGLALGRQARSFMPPLAPRTLQPKKVKPKSGFAPLVVGRLPPDTVRTGQLALFGKPQAPDSVRTGQLLLVGKPQVPDTVYTGQLALISKTRIPDIVPTGPLILKGK